MTAEMTAAPAAERARSDKLNLTSDRDFNLWGWDICVSSFVGTDLLSMFPSNPTRFAAAVNQDGGIVLDPPIRNAKTSSSKMAALN